MKRFARFVLLCAALAFAVAVPLAVAFGQPVQAPGYFGATPIAVSTTGTTLATAAAIPAVAGKTAYLCGLSVRSNATAAVTGDITAAGLKGGTMTFKHFTAPVATGIGITEPPFNICLPASARNVAITVTAPAAGTAGLVTVNVWGFYQ